MGSLEWCNSYRAGLGRGAFWVALDQSLSLHLPNRAVVSTTGKELCTPSELLGRYSNVKKGGSWKPWGVCRFLAYTLSSSPNTLKKSEYVFGMIQAVFFITEKWISKSIFNLRELATSEV